jgi:hypothetical protein
MSGYYFKIGHNCYNPVIIKLYYFHVPMSLFNFLGIVDTKSLNNINQLPPR